jgi:superfamily I DNA/RNA helicase
MTPGERRTAERLEQKLDAGDLLWYDVAVGPRHQHPDFVVMHPRRGILILEVKDFRLSTLIQAHKQTCDIHGEPGPKTLPNPLERARQYAHQVVDALERDPQLVQPEGRHKGKQARRCTRRSRRPAARRVTAVGHRVVQIPSGQYQAVMIGEGHDFAPQWLKVLVQMVQPATNSLIVLYDDAQSIDERAQKKNFSYKSVGIQAQGRTTILKINYRNARQILHTASLVAADPLTADDKDNDGIPWLKPVSCGREGQEPLIIKLPTLQAEAEAIADHLAQAHQEGFAWGDMAVLCADSKTRDLCARTLAQRKLPVENRLSSGDFDPTSNKIKVMTMKVSKGLEFPVVALPGVGHMPANGEDEKEAARVFYVAATRATQRLVMGLGRDRGSANLLN